MKCNTNGEIIPEMLDICNCESTYGCDKCRPPVKINKFGKMSASWKNLDFTIKIKQRKIEGSKMEKYLLSKKNLKALVENVRDTPEWSDDRHINLLTNYTNPASKIMEGEVLESSMGTPFLKIDYVTKNIKDIGKWAYLVAIAYGIIFSFLFGAAFIGFSFQNVVIFIVQGILVGGAATGVYDIAKFMKH